MISEVSLEWLLRALKFYVNGVDRGETRGFLMRYAQDCGILRRGMGFFSIICYLGNVLGRRVYIFYRIRRFRLTNLPRQKLVYL